MFVDFVAQVKWLGYERVENTFERFGQLKQDVYAMLKKFLKKEIVVYCVN